ncbi:MAG: hypothetical protein QM655_15820, partial [Nocardioidaceae bacterium]
MEASSLRAADEESHAGSINIGVIRSQQWALNTSIADDGTIASSAAEPETRALTFQSNGAVELVVRAGAPFANEPTDGLSAPGSLLDREIYEPGQFDNPYPNPPPTDPSEIGAYLAQSIGITKPTAGDYLRGIDDLLNNRLLNAAEEAAVLQFLATLKGLKLAGAVTDRLDRNGIAYIATDRRPGEYEDMLIV